MYQSRSVNEENRPPPSINTDPARPYVPSEWLPLVHLHVTPDLLTAVRDKYPYSIDSESLAACLYVFTRNTMDSRKPQERLHTVPDAAIAGFLASLRRSGLLKASCGNRNKRVAMVRLLVLSGLIVVRDGRYRIGGRIRGIAKRYGLGERHPQYKEFVSAFGNVVDAKPLETAASKAAA